MACRFRLPGSRPDRPDVAGSPRETGRLPAWLVQDVPRGAPVPREGLPKEQQAALLRIVVPGSPESPVTPDQQFRNYVLVLVYFQLGLSLSEALALKTSDLTLVGDMPRIQIERRADDPDDPRKRQPLVKINACILPVGNLLAPALSQWITEHRSDRKRYPAARRHRYIFVAAGGRPAVEGRGRARVRDLAAMRRPRPALSAHVLRHTWNDNFSRLVDEGDLPDATEKLLRNHLMGWMSTSEQGGRTRNARRARKPTASC